MNSSIIKLKKISKVKYMPPEFIILYFKYNYNQAIMFPSKFIHFSQNVENFTNKKSLAIFTDVR